MKSMQDKLTAQLKVGSYSMSGFLVAIGKFDTWLSDLDWNKIAIIMGIIIGIATYFTSAYFQSRQTKAIEKAAESGKQIVPGD